MNIPYKYHKHTWFGIRRYSTWPSIIILSPVKNMPNMPRLCQENTGDQQILSSFPMNPLSWLEVYKSWANHYCKSNLSKSLRESTLHPSTPSLLSQIAPVKYKAISHWPLAVRTCQFPPDFQGAIREGISSRKGNDNSPVAPNLHIQHPKNSLKKNVQS